MKQLISIVMMLNLALTSPAPVSAGPSAFAFTPERSLANSPQDSLVLMDATLTAGLVERLANPQSSYQIEQTARELDSLKSQLEQKLNDFLATDFAPLEMVADESGNSKVQQAFAQTALFFQLAEKLEGQKIQNQILSSPEQWKQIYSIEIDVMTSLNYFTFLAGVFQLADQPESPFRAEMISTHNQWRLQLSLHPVLFDQFFENYLAARFSQDVLMYSRILLAKDQYNNLARINGLLRRPLAQLPSPPSLPVFQKLMQTVPEFVFLKDVLSEKEAHQLKKYTADQWSNARDAARVAQELFLNTSHIRQMLAALKLNSDVDVESQVAAIQDLFKANVVQILELERQLIATYRGPWSESVAAELSLLAQYMIFNAAFTRYISTFKNLDPDLHTTELQRTRNEVFKILQAAFSATKSLSRSLPSAAHLFDEKELLNQFLLRQKRDFVTQLNSDVESIENILKQTDLPIDMALVASVLSGEFELSGYHARWINQLVQNNDYATSTVQYHEFFMNQLELVGTSGDAFSQALEQPSVESYQAALQQAFAAQSLNQDQFEELEAFLEAGKSLGFFNPSYLANPDDVSPLLVAALSDLKLTSKQLKQYQELYAERATQLNHLLSLYVEDFSPLYACNPSSPDTFSHDDPLWKNWSRFQGVRNQHCTIDQYLVQMEKSALQTLQDLNPEEPGLIRSALGWVGNQFDAKTKQTDSNQNIIELLAHSSLYTAALQTHSHFDLDTQRIVETYAQAPAARALFDKFYNEVLHPVFWATLFYQIAKFGLRFANPNLHGAINKFEKQLLTPFFGSRYQLASGVMLVAVLGYLGLEIKDTVGESQVEQTLRAYHFSSFNDETSLVKTADWSQQQQAYKASRNSLYLTAALLGGFVIGIYAVRSLFHSYMKNYARTGAFVKKHKKFIEEGLGFQPGRWSLTRENTQGALRAQINRIRQSSNLNPAEKERLIAQYKKQVLAIETELETIGRAFIYAPPHLTRAVYDLGLNNVHVVGRNATAWAHPSRLSAARTFWENQYKNGQLNFSQWQTKKSQLEEVAAYAQAQKNWYRTSHDHLEAAQQGARRARPQAQQSDDFLSLHNEFQWSKGVDSLNWDVIKNQNDWLGILDAGFRWKIIQKGRHWRLEAEAVDRSNAQNRIAQDVRKLIEDKTK